MTAPLFDFVRFKDESGSTHAIRKRGRKHYHLVIIGHPIYVLRVLIARSEGITPLAQELSRTVASFSAAAERCGITDGARTILDEAKEAVNE
ncbi:MAG: hypothetical protein ACREA0_11470 [bacterium]